jgi:hypothetical protein
MLHQSAAQRGGALRPHQQQHTLWWRAAGTFGPLPRRAARHAPAATAPNLSPATAASTDDDQLTAEQRLHLQLRALPTVSADGLAAAAAAAQPGDASTTQQQQQSQSAQQSQKQQQRQQQRRGPLAWLAARLPAGLPPLDGRLKGLLLLNAMVLLMGSNWVCVKASGDATMTDSMMFMGLRFALASALFIPFLKPDKAIAKAGLEVGAWYAGGYVTQAMALAHTDASRASLLSTFTVLAVPMIAGMSGQRIRPIVWGCSAAALMGTAMLVSPPPGRVCGCAPALALLMLGATTGQQPT